MADDAAGGLLVQIGVTQARMERELATLVKAASKSANDMEKGFTSANDNIGKSTQRSFGGIPKAANDATKGVKNTSFAVSNLTSQLNDIGVQLAGGQSPFQVMLQQGTQIGQLYAQTGGGIKNFGSILAGAAMSAVSPFNLLTFALIGLGGYAIQYFEKVMSGGEDSDKVIKEHNELIQNVAKSWGDAVPAIQAYAEQVQSLKDISDLKGAAEIINKQTVDDAISNISDVKIAFSDLTSQLHAAGEEDQVIQNLETAMNDFNKAAQAGKDTTAESKAVQDALAAAINSSGIPAISAFANMFDVLSIAAASAAKNVASVNAQVANATKGLSMEQVAHGSTFNDNGTTRNRDDVVPQGDIPTPGANPLRNLSLDHDDLYGKPKRGGGGRKAKGADSYKDEVTSIQDRTKALQAGTAAQAAINPLVNDFGFALEKAKTEQALLADAQKSGLTITPQLREQISALADTYAQASAQSKELAKSQEDIRKQAEEWASLEKDTFKGFLSDLKDGKSGAEALSNALNKVADKLLDMAVDSLFSTNGSAGGGSGIFSSIFGGIGKLFGFASGTANTGSRPGTPVGIVHGQEAVIPLPSGGRVPVTIATPKANAQKSSNDTVSINLTDDSGRMAAIANQQIQTASGTIVHVAVTQSYKQVKGNMAGLMTDAQARAL